MSVAFANHPSEEVNPLSQLKVLLASKIKSVDKCLRDFAYSDVAELPSISAHIIESGGKRLRPLLTLAAAEMCSCHEGDRAIRMAACIELLHTATLLHDDVVDESELRRSRPTANKVWGNQLSILGGDFLFSKMFDLLVRDGSLEILGLFVNTSQTLIEGEVLQIKTRFNSEVTESDYFKIIEAKTASLFQAALELGGRVAGVSQNELNALAEYAYNIGVAFQLMDDVLDYTSDAATLGKPEGNDFFEGQMTLPLIYLRLLIDRGEEFFALKAILSKAERTIEDLVWVQKQLEIHQVSKKISDLAMRFAAKAKNSLVELPEHPVRDLLAQLTVFVVERCK